MMCQQGGDANLVGVSGGQVVTFKNVGDCVSFASQGGQLVLRSLAEPCLNGGYSDWLTEAKVAFTSQAECVTYVGNGGKLVAKPTLALTITRIGNSVYFEVTGHTPGDQLCFQALQANGANYGRLICGEAGETWQLNGGYACGEFYQPATVRITNSTTGEQVTEPFPVC